MRRSIDARFRARAAVCVLHAVFAGAACRQHPPSLPPLVAQVSGTIEEAGLSAPVRVDRDTWGVPHIYARSQDDLFFAQGFVQAQDRLFQMDLWRRSVQGRLSEVLGPNFIERDAMTRRVQYRGSLDEEWASYGSDTKAIATAFVRGVNAWVARARAQPPEEFVLAGWIPDFWSPIDLLNRTDAFLASGDAVDEIARTGLSDIVADALRRVGTPPFLLGLAADVTANRQAAGSSGAPGANEASAGLNEDAVHASAAGSVRATRGALSFSEARARFENPNARYFVHLNAPGWNVVGVTSPWLPGVAAGHNDRIAWGMTKRDVDTEDVYIESGGGGAGSTVKESIVVKGRPSPFEFDIVTTPHGVVIALDREHDRAFTVRWSGMQTGAAAELGALALDRARTWTEFRAALARWKMPARRVVFADADGNIGFQDAALVPKRSGQVWNGWLTIDDLPNAFNPRGASIAASDPRRDVEARPLSPRALFAHILGVSRDARARFNVGPIDRPRGDDGVVRVAFDATAWDRSRAILAPGQSGSAASPHFGDLARLWGSGGDFPLAFSDDAVRAKVESTLLIVNKQPR